MFNFIKKLFVLNKTAYIWFSVHYDAITDCNVKYFIKETSGLKAVFHKKMQMKEF